MNDKIIQAAVDAKDGIRRAPKQVWRFIERLHRRIISWYIFRMGFTAVEITHLESLETILHAFRKAQPDNSYFGRETVTRLYDGSK